jgi:phage shock protein C
MTSFFANVRGGTLLFKSEIVNLISKIVNLSTFKKLNLSNLQIIMYICLRYISMYSKSRLMPNNLLQNWLKDMVERNAYGACRYLGDKMNVAPAEVRKYFIYTSFIGMGSPIIVYLVVAFWYNVRKYIRRGMSTIWE